MGKIKTWTVVVAGVAVFGALGFTPAGAAPEPPAPRGMQLIKKTSDMTVSSAKTAQVSCPRNPVVKRTMGGGARIRTPDGLGGGGEVKFTALNPLDIGNTGTFIYMATATARPGYGQPWAIEIWALCGEVDPDGDDGYELVIPSEFGDDDPGNDPVDSVNGHAELTLTCSPGKRLLAAGARALPDNNADLHHISLTKIEPNPDNRSARISADDDATDGTPPVRFRLVPYRVCIEDVSSYQRVVTDDTALNPTTPKSRRAECGSGQIAYSFGLTKVDATGHAAVDGATPTELVNGLPTQYVVRATQKAPLSNWGLRGYAICAKPLPIQD
jgi:hypothetical protein